MLIYTSFVGFVLKNPPLDSWKNMRKSNFRDVPLLIGEDFYSVMPALVCIASSQMIRLSQF